jgi:hypothetical protein
MLCLIVAYAFSSTTLEKRTEVRVLGEREVLGSSGEK